MNIEKTISEHAVSDILTPMLESQDRIVTEDVAPLFDQATGLDTPPASGTVTTTIEESRSVITAIIRKAWTATLTMLGGASVISYIAAAYTYLRNRLQGNETYGIPDRRSEISASSPLAANLALLNDRKISEPNAIEGMSLANMLLGSPITEISDSNHGWDLTRALNTLWTILPNLSHSRLALNFGSAPVGVSFTLGADAEELVFDDIEEFGATSGYPGQTYDIAHGNSRVKKISIAKLRKWERGVNGGIGSLCPNLEEIYAPSLSYINYNYWHYTRNENSFYGATSLRKTVFGGPNNTFKVLDNANDGYNCLNWIHMEFRGEVSISLNLTGWNPTNALDASRTDLIEEGSTAQNNLQQFLENFRSFIALRLTDNGSGKTLTLSQAVRNAIHAAESTYGIENIIITQKGWTISPAPN